MKIIFCVMLLVLMPGTYKLWNGYINGGKAEENCGAKIINYKNDEPVENSFAYLNKSIKENYHD